MKPTLVFDMDGTLNRCGEYYKEVMEQFAAYKAERADVSKDFVLKLLGEIDLIATDLPDAFKRHRFPRSFMATSATVDVLLERNIDWNEADRAFQIGDSVFDAPYELYPTVWETLVELKKADWHLVLVTKGDFGVQWQKVTKNSLDFIFKRDDIYVTLKKTPELMWEIIEQQEIDVDSSYVIGDSLKDDIRVGMDVGMKTILVDSGKWWEYDHHEIEPTHVITTLAQVPGIVGTPWLTRV